MFGGGEGPACFKQLIQNISELLHCVDFMQSSSSNHPNNVIQTLIATTWTPLKLGHKHITPTTILYREKDVQGRKRGIYTDMNRLSKCEMERKTMTGDRQRERQQFARCCSEGGGERRRRWCYLG